MERPEKGNTLKGVVSRTQWNTLLQKAPPELSQRAKSQEDDLERDNVSQGWISLQYVLEAASLSGGARALSSRLNSLSIELETSIVNPALSVRLGEDLKPFILKLLNREHELKVARTELTRLREAVEVLLNVVKIDFQNKLSETGYHIRVRSLLNSVLFLLRVPEEFRVLCSSKTENYSNFLKGSELIETAKRILSQTDYVSCDGLDQIRDEILKLTEDLASQIIDILCVELFLGIADLSFLLSDTNQNEELLLKEKLTNLLSSLCKLQYSTRSGDYCCNHFRKHLIALIERCIAEARELYLRRSPVARVKEEPRGYDLLNRGSFVSNFPILWRGLTEEDSRRLSLFVKVLTSALLEVLRRFRMTKDLMVKLDDEDNYPTLGTLWLSMQQMVVVELGYLLETEYPNVEYFDTANVSQQHLSSFPLRSKGLRESFEEKIAKSCTKSSALYTHVSSVYVDDRHTESNLEQNHLKSRTAEGQLTSLANQTCYWLGLQPSVLWTPVIYDAIIDFHEKGDALALEPKQPLSQHVNSRQKRAINGNNNDNILFVFLEGFLKNHFCKVASERIDVETRRLCSESDSFTAIEPFFEVFEDGAFDQTPSPIVLMKNLCRRKLLDSYRMGSQRIFKCCWEAYSIIEEAHSLETSLRESFQATGMFSRLMAPLCSRFGDTFIRIIKALLMPSWNESIVEWLMQHYREQPDVTVLRDLLPSIPSELSVETLRMLIVIHNSTCFLLETLHMREKEKSLKTSTAALDDTNPWVELNMITNICIKVFELECVNLIERSQRSCTNESRKISYCSATFLKQQYAYFFEVASQCRGFSLLTNVCSRIHDYSATFLLTDCKYCKNQNEEKASVTTL
ncbi:hypothetical protein GpartN1_g652.t1 [Galdieria partita]|uniref:Uncharacterized protein n=1 Tax=Galdieria partita TaxID=83374 RepID=A0A9C7UN04_9RHOD|nr:hypothetical protein GpartN1_g652.t1 [Galdieria partita]